MFGFNLSLSSSSTATTSSASPFGSAISGSGSLFGSSPENPSSSPSSPFSFSLNGSSNSTPAFASSFANNFSWSSSAATSASTPAAAVSTPSVFGSPSPLFSTTSSSGFPSVSQTSSATTSGFNRSTLSAASSATTSSFSSGSQPSFSLSNAASSTAKPTSPSPLSSTVTTTSASTPAASTGVAADEDMPNWYSSDSGGATPDAAAKSGFSQEFKDVSAEHLARSQTVDPSAEELSARRSRLFHHSSSNEENDTFDFSFLELPCEEGNDSSPSYTEADLEATKRTLKSYLNLDLYALTGHQQKAFRASLSFLQSAAPLDSSALSTFATVVDNLFSSSSQAAHSEADLTRKISALKLDKDAFERMVAQKASYATELNNVMTQYDAVEAQIREHQVAILRLREEQKSLLSRGEVLQQETADLKMDIHRLHSFFETRKASATEWIGKLAKIRVQKQVYSREWSSLRAFDFDSLF